MDNKIHADDDNEEPSLLTLVLSSPLRQESKVATVDGLYYYLELAIQFGMSKEHDGSD